MAQWTERERTNLGYIGLLFFFSQLFFLSSMVLVILFFFTVSSSFPVVSSLSSPSPSPLALHTSLSSLWLIRLPTWSNECGIEHLGNATLLLSVACPNYEIRASGGGGVFVHISILCMIFNQLF
ncbi:hypothetical protein LI328DRAFT_80655 [Trichoderma asperelloides]|nr:hypothetical protein LI328DRAFT_80655 [Trichoderma asperelloides]